MDFRTRLNQIDVSRRKLLVGAAAGGGLLVAWSLWPRSYSSPMIAGEGEALFGGWLVIGRDGVVTVALPQLEMGQGVGTVLAQVAATELGADWRQMGIEPVPPGGHFANLPLAAEWAPLWSQFPSWADEADDWLVERFARQSAFSVTALGTSLEAFELPLREAAATARDMLTRAAAERWNVEPEACEVVEGFVIHKGSRLPFGALVMDAAQLDPPDPAPLRPLPASEEPIPGEADAASIYPRLDLPSKVDGSHIFAGDVRLPGMLYASVRHGPVGLPELLRFDEDAVSGMRGLRSVVKSKRWIAAVADSWWIADQALAKMRAQFTGPGALEQIVLATEMERAIEEAEDRAERFHTFGDPDGMLDEAATARRYDFAPAAHAPLETASATARFENGRLELWIGSQAPSAAREAAAKAVGISPNDVVLYPVSAGGSFDARLEKQHAIEVAQIAAQVGRPVQLTWSRAQDLQAVPPRPPVSVEIAATVGAQGQPVAWRSRIAAPSAMIETGGRLFDNLVPEAAKERGLGTPDRFVVEGAVPAYGISNIAVEHVPADIVLPVGRMRGGAFGWTTFANECFIDELARSAGRDPFLYRMAMLGGAPRMAECLRRATRLGDWDGGREGSGQGLAMARMGNDPATAGHIACVAQTGPGEGRIRVIRLTAAVDIGRIVNLDVARQQIEGGLVYGLSLAIGSSLGYRKGHPVPRTLGGLGLPILATCPDIVVDFIASEAEPFDPGELGVVVSAPAIANALFTQTGTRLLNVPFFAENS